METPKDAYATGPGAKPINLNSKQGSQRVQSYGKSFSHYLDICFMLQKKDAQKDSTH